MKRFPALAILYYGFTVIIGVILVFYFLTYSATNKTSKTLTSYANESKFFEMTQLLSVYQDKEVVLENTLEDGTKFAIYRVDATYSKTVDNSTKYYVEKGYMGLITNPGESWNRSEYSDNDGVTHNNFGLKFNGTSSTGEAKTYNYRIGYVSGEKYESTTEENAIKNRWYSYETCKFYFFMVGDVEFEENNLESISSFSFVNADSSVSSTVNFDTPLTLTGTFFEKMTEFNTNYNKLIDDSASNDVIENYVDNMDNEITKLGFSKTNYSELVKYVPLQNVLKIVGYFLVILIIGDFLVGKHHIIHLFARIFGKSKKATNETPEYMDDYEVNVTFKANVESDVKSVITITYISESGNEVTFTLSPSNSYEETKRIKNGNYMNPKIECSDLSCSDVPSTLAIKGFKYYQEFKFTKNN